jgi:hypothetical protein
MHEGIHFGSGPFPVLYAERIQRQGFDAEIDAVQGDSLDRSCAPAVSLDARQRSLLRPAAVAVHDDGQMARYLFGCQSKTLGGFVEFLFKGLHSG